jgi:hypothetical protein
VLIRIEYKKAVKRIAVLGGMHLGFNDGVAEALEKIANAREQIFAVAHIDHDLDTVACRAQPGSDDDRKRVDMREEQAAVPGNLLAFMTQEIQTAEFLPQRLVRRFDDAVVVQDRTCLALAQQQLTIGIDAVSTQ